MWAHQRHHFYDGPFIFDSRQQMNPPSRFWYDGDQQYNCTLKIHNVEQNDTGEYAFRFITDIPGGKYTGLPGSTLKVLGEFNFSVTQNSDSVCKDGHLSNAFCFFRFENYVDKWEWNIKGRQLCESDLCEQL